LEFLQARRFAIQLSNLRAWEVLSKQ